MPGAWEQTRPSVTVCRGCCCGTAKKHPTIDHDAELESLVDQIDGVGNVRVTECLGPCERSNIVVVSPSRIGRRTGGRPTWLGFVLESGAKRDIAEWLRRGGPGLADMPESLTRYRFDGPAKKHRS